MKTTDWFDGNVQPARHGVYEVQISPSTQPCLCRWDGPVDGRFHDLASQAGYAYWPVVRWRGLTEEGYRDAKELDRTMAHARVLMVLTEIEPRFRNTKEFATQCVMLRDVLLDGFVNGKSLDALMAEARSLSAQLKEGR